MDWTTEFYGLQQRLADVYSGPVMAHHRTDAAELTARLPPGADALELGAGGGQRAVALAELGCQVTAIEVQESAVAHTDSVHFRTIRNRAGWSSNSRNPHWAVFAPLKKFRKQHGIFRTPYHARALLNSSTSAGRLTLHAADFYTAELAGPFDAVGYWDGFGIGSDADQRRLLKRMRGWLRPGGVVLMDLFTPWYWAEVAGARHEGSDWIREYDFDAEGCRMLDTWWAKADPQRRLTQSLRCYAPADLGLLLEGTGLRLEEVVPGGRFDQGSRAYTEHAPLHRAMTYRAWLRPC